jgi:plastocyanin
MSIYGRRVPVPALAGLVLLLIVVALPVVSSGPVREIVMVADGMAFRAEADQSQTNPVIEVQAGETIRIVLRNEERGMRHDFAVPVLGIALDLVEWGDQNAVTFVAPSQPGDYEYVCQPHRVMMRGVLRVVLT